MTGPRDPLDDRASCLEWLALLAGVALVWVGIILLGLYVWRAIA